MIKLTYLGSSPWSWGDSTVMPGSTIELDSGDGAAASAALKAINAPYRVMEPGLDVVVVVPTEIEYVEASSAMVADIAAGESDRVRRPKRRASQATEVEASADTSVPVDIMIGGDDNAAGEP